MTAHTTPSTVPHVAHNPQPPLSKDLMAQFIAIVGAKNAITDPADQEPYLVEQRNLYRGNTPLILRAGSTEEVSKILKLANETKTAIVPMGGNTGLVGGQTPHNGEVVLSLARMDKIRDMDPASNSMTCEAGVVLIKAQEAAAAADRLFPLSLGAEGSCTIGGNLSTNAGGTGALAYGVARDLVLGLEVVLADGRVMHMLNKLKKDNTGYDLRHLFIGAEGTLGIITAAVLKLFPRPRAVETAFIGVPSTEAALEFLSLVQSHTGGGATSFELIARSGIDMSIKHGPGIRDPLGSVHPWYVLLQLSSQSTENSRAQMENVLEAGMDKGLILDATIAESVEQTRAFWKIREFLPDAQKPEGGSIKHDVSVPVAKVPEFLKRADEAVEKLIPGTRPVPFGHMGDGNIHYNVSQPVGMDRNAFLMRWYDVNDVVHQVVNDLGGSISAEHGIGVIKRDLLPHIKDPVAFETMQMLKKSFDPNGILNPGKVV